MERVRLSKDVEDPLKRHALKDRRFILDYENAI